MQPIRTIIVSFSLLAATAAGFAQSTAGSGLNGGLLGQRYGEFTFGVTDFHGFPDNAMGLGATVNLPLTPSVDLGFHYSHDWLNSAFDLRSDGLAVGAVAHGNSPGLKPFGALALGYQWARISAPGGFRDRESEGVWLAAAGVEWPAGPITLTPRVGYTGSFEDSSSGSFHAGLEAHRWFTSKVGGYADVSYGDQRGAGGGSWSYTIGLRMRF